MGAGSKTRARAAKAAWRKQLANLPTLAPVERREKDGNSTRKSRRGPREEAGADIVALDKRAALMGKKILPLDIKDKAKARENAEMNRQVRTEMRAQSHTDEAGRAICLYRKGEARQKLLDIWNGLRTAEERYHRIVLGQSIHAKTSKIEMEPETLETSADAAPPDLRTDEERERAAVNTWMRWKGYTMHLPASQREAIWKATRGAVELHRGDALTPHGKAFVVAMDALSEVVD